VSTKAGITTYIALYVDDLLIISEDDDQRVEGSQSGSISSVKPTGTPARITSAPRGACS